MAQITRGGGLVDAPPESIRELADSAMLLSGGAHRATELRRQTDGAALDGRPLRQPPKADANPPRDRESLSLVDFAGWCRHQGMVCAQRSFAH
jgi:hypothetical protein